MLAYQCLARRQSGQQKINLYFNVTGHVDEEDYQRALADVYAHRLAGLYLTYSLSLRNTPLFTLPGIARVTLGITADVLPSIISSIAQFYTKGLDYLAARGRRRIALMGYALPADKAFCDELLAARNLDMPAHCFIPALPIGWGEPFTIIRHYCYLLMRDPHDRPDCVLVSDDIATDSVVAGILDAGLRVGEDVDVVAHCNYPLLKPDLWPVKRLGFPVPAVLDAVFALIHRQRRGEAKPADVSIPFLFDEEYATLSSGGCETLPRAAHRRGRERCAAHPGEQMKMSHIN